MGWEEGKTGVDPEKLQEDGEESWSLPLMVCFSINWKGRSIYGE